MPLAMHFAGAIERADSSDPNLPHRVRNRGHLRKREKVFGEGRCVPLDREAKVRIVTLARALMRPTESGRHWGLVTAKFIAVFEALLWGFHNAATGKCFPSYEAIAEKADVARSTVYEAIKALEAAGILSWVNRIKRVREWGPDLFGRALNRWRVVRTSNQYVLIDPKKPAKPPDSSKSELQTGTTVQGFILTAPTVLEPKKELLEVLAGPLARLEAAVRTAR